MEICVTGKVRAFWLYMLAGLLCLANSSHAPAAPAGLPDTSKMNLLFIILVASLCVLCGPLSGAQTSPAKPNILFIVGDDMGYADVGFHGFLGGAHSYVNATGVLRGDEQVKELDYKLVRSDEWLPTAALGGERIVKHAVSRNNILHVRTSKHWSASGNKQNADNDFDFDLCNGRVPEGQEANAIRGVPMFPAPAHAPATHKKKQPRR